MFSFFLFKVQSIIKNPKGDENNSVKLENMFGYFLINMKIENGQNDFSQMLV